METQEALRISLREVETKIKNIRAHEVKLQRVADYLKDSLIKKGRGSGRTGQRGNGMKPSVAGYAYEILLRDGPKTTRDVYEALIEEGGKSKSARVMYQSLYQDPRMRLVGHQWELVPQ